MKEKLLARLIRFGFAVLLAWLFLHYLPALLPRLSMPMGDMSVSFFQRRPVTQLIAQAAPATLSWLAQALAYGLLPGLALGLFAGKQGSVSDRLLHGPVLLLTAMPAFLPAIAGIYWLGLKGGRPIPGAALAGLAVVAGAWIAWAMREGALRARTAEDKLDTVPAFLTGVGMLLRQFGNLLAAVLLTELVAGRPGLGKLLVSAVMARDYPVVLGVAPVLIFTTLLIHLAGDLLVTFTVRRESPASRPCPGWLTAGAVLTALLLAAAVASPLAPGHLLGTDQTGREVLPLLAAGTRTSLLIALLVTLVASVGGALLGAAGSFTGRAGAEILAPRRTTLAALWPLALLLPLFLAVRPGFPGLIVLIGLLSIPLMAYPVRRLIQALRDHEAVRGALLSLFGGLALVLAGALLTEAILSFIGAGVMPPTNSLGNIMAGGARFLRQAPHILFYSGAVTAVGVGGLFLLGRALTEAAGHETGE